MTYPVNRDKWLTRFALALACLFIVPGGWTAGQRRNPLRNATGFDDVTFAISFSPDGRTLAIARGAAEPSQRFGRIELWDTETGTLRHVIKGFDGPVRSLSFSPDGQTLVSGSIEYRHSKIREKARSREGSIVAQLKWWDAQTGDLKHQLTLPGEGSTALNASYSPDGKQLAVVESFIHWSILSSYPNNPGFPGFGDPLPSAFPMSGRPIVAVSANMKLLDAETGEEKLKLKASQMGRVIFSPNGKFLALASGGEIKLWNSQTGKEEIKLKGFKGRPNAMAFSPDGQTLAVASTHYDHESAGRYIKIIGKSEVKLFDVPTWQVKLTFPDSGAVNTLEFGPSGRVLMIGGVMSAKRGDFPGVKLVDLNTGNAANLPTGESFTEAVDSLAVSRDGRFLAFRSGPATVQMLDTDTWKVKQTWDASSVGNAVERPTSRFLLSVKRVLAVAFSADGKTLSGETDQGEIKWWDPRTGETKKQLTGDQDDPSFVAVSADGKSFAEISNGKVLLWDANSGTKSNLPLPDGLLISAVAISADNQTVAIGSGDDLIFITPKGDVTQKLTSQHGSVNLLAFSEDGRAIASAEEDGDIEIWDVANARVEKTIRAGTKITALRFAPNGQALATAAEDHSITLWHRQTGLAQQKLQKHDAFVNALVFSPDGLLLASGGDDRMVVLWEVASGKAKRTLKDHDQTVTALAFSPDGSLLASGSGNASVVLWEVPTGKLNRVLR